MMNTLPPFAYYTDEHDRVFFTDQYVDELGHGSDNIVIADPDNPNQVKRILKPPAVWRNVYTADHENGMLRTILESTPAIRRLFPATCTEYVAETINGRQCWCQTQTKLESVMHKYEDLQHPRPDQVALYANRRAQFANNFADKIIDALNCEPETFISTDLKVSQLGFVNDGTADVFLYDTGSTSRGIVQGVTYKTTYPCTSTWIDGIVPPQISNLRYQTLFAAAQTFCDLIDDKYNAILGYRYMSQFHGGPWARNRFLVDRLQHCVQKNTTLAGKECILPALVTYFLDALQSPRDGHDDAAGEFAAFVDRASVF